MDNCNMNNNSYTNAGFTYVEKAHCSVVLPTIGKEETKMMMKNTSSAFPVIEEVEMNGFNKREDGIAATQQKSPTLSLKVESPSSSKRRTSTRLLVKKPKVTKKPTATMKPKKKATWIKKKDSNKPFYELNTEHYPKNASKIKKCKNDRKLRVIKNEKCERFDKLCGNDSLLTNVFQKLMDIDKKTIVAKDDTEFKKIFEDEQGDFLTAFSNYIMETP